MVGLAKKWRVLVYLLVQLSTSAIYFPKRTLMLASLWFLCLRNGLRNPPLGSGYPEWPALPWAGRGTMCATPAPPPASGLCTTTPGSSGFQWARRPGDRGGSSGVTAKGTCLPLLTISLFSGWFSERIYHCWKSNFSRGRTSKWKCSLSAMQLCNRSSCRDAPKAPCQAYAQVSGEKLAGNTLWAFVSRGSLAKWRF